MAHKFLGRVIKGFQIGSKFGIATANLEVKDIPKNLKAGVYLINVKLTHPQNNIKSDFKIKSLNALMHFGERKTFGSDFSIEVHILDFSKDIYDDYLEVEILKYLRETREFLNGDALFTQIADDISTAKIYFEKKELRKKIYKNWKNLTKTAIKSFAKYSLEKISKNTDFLNSKNIAIYAPQKSCEIDFTEDLMNMFPEKKYFFPKVLNKISGEMQFFEVKKYQDLVIGEFNLLEPKISRSVIINSQGDENKQTEILENFDLIFIPALAVDKNKNRLGKGGGFYDRFLAKLKIDNLDNYQKIKKITVLPKFSVLDQIPAEKYDEKINEVISIST